MNWPCCISRRIDFSFGLCVKPYLNSAQRNFLFPRELDGAKSLSWGHFSIHFICLPFSLSLPLSLLPLSSSEHTEIEQAWLMQHLSSPNVRFAQPFYAWLLFGKMLFMHLPMLLLNYHMSWSIKQTFNIWWAGSVKETHNGWIRHWLSMLLLYFHKSDM